MKPKNRLRKRLWKENWIPFKIAPKGNLSRDAKMGAARSCLEARAHRAKIQSESREHCARGTATPCHMAQSCHLASRPLCRARVVRSGFLPRDVRAWSVEFYAMLFSPSWHSFLLNVVHLFVSSIEFLKISKDVIWVKSALKEADLTLPWYNRMWKRMTKWVK